MKKLVKESLNDLQFHEKFYRSHTFNKRIKTDYSDAILNAIKMYNIHTDFDFDEALDVGIYGEQTLLYREKESDVYAAITYGKLSKSKYLVKFTTTIDNYIDNVDEELEYDNITDIAKDFVSFLEEIYDILLNPEDNEDIEED